MLTGGSNLVYRKPAYSSDGKKLLVCTGNTVSIYSVATGLLVNQLEGHRGQVTTVIVVPISGPANKLICQCWTSSLDATVCLWDFNTATLLQTVQVVRPVVSMAIPILMRPSAGNGTVCQDLYAFLSVEGKERQNGQLASWCGHTVVHNLTKKVQVKGHIKQSHIPQLLVVSPSGGLVGMADKRKIHVWKVPLEGIESAEDVKKIRLHHTKDLCSLAFHPNDMIVAGGDSSGRILIWRGVGECTFSSAGFSKDGDKIIQPVTRPGVKHNDDATSCTTWHWHSSEVKFLSFSSDGAYLYSGGKEGCLVIWQLETGKRQYLPRLGAPLLFLANSPDPALFSISSADNKIMLTNIATMTIEKSIVGIKPPFSLPEKFKSLCNNGPVVDPKAGMLVLPAHNHSVQFYDVFYDRPVSEVLVSQRNYIPANDLTVFITLVAISPDGSVMGTVEVKLPEEGIGGGFSLKFWSIKSGSGQFLLSTVIDEPHSDGAVSTLIFHPRMNMAVSCSFRGNFKVWVENDSALRNHAFGQSHGWRCRSVGSYKQKAMLCAGFSGDGSLLAVGTGDLITLWNPNTNSLVSVLGESLHSQPVLALSFIPMSRHLVTVSKGSKPQLCVWNLSSLCLWWSHHLTVEAIASDPSRPNFAVLAPFPLRVNAKRKSEEDAVIVLFSVEDPIPVASWIVRKGMGGKVMFIKPRSLLPEENESGKSKVEENRLVFLSRDHEFAVFNPYSDDDDDQAMIGSAIRFSSVEDQGPSGYEAMFGKISSQQKKVENISSEIKNQKFFPAGANHPWETIFNGASHVLPPLTRIGPAFLESLLEKATQQQP